MARPWESMVQLCKRWERVSSLLGFVENGYWLTISIFLSIISTNRFSISRTFFWTPPWSFLLLTRSSRIQHKGKSREKLERKVYLSLVGMLSCIYQTLPAWDLILWFFSFTSWDSLWGRRLLSAFPRLALQISTFDFRTLPSHSLPSSFSDKSQTIQLRFKSSLSLSEWFCERVSSQLSPFGKDDASRPLGFLASRNYRW